MVEGPLAEVGAEEGLVHAAAGHGGGHGQVAAGEALADADDVGADAGLLDGEQRARAAEAGGDLVAHQEHVGTPARGGHRGELGRLVQVHAVGALHQWLEDDRGHPVPVLGEERLEGLDGTRRAEARRAEHGEAERVEHVGAEAAVADGDPAHGVAVVRRAEGHVGGAAR